MADTQTKAPNVKAQFQASGYILDEDSEFAMRDMFVAQSAVADLYDRISLDGENHDITGEDVASVMRTFARIGQRLLAPAPITFDATARARASAR